MKKALTVILSVVLSVSLTMPALATTDSVETYEEVIISENFAGSADVNSKYSAELIDAYISFSKQLDSLGVSANTCLEDFILGSENTSEDSIQSYISSLIEVEVSAANERNNNTSMNISNRENNEVAPYGSLGSQWYDDIGNITPKLPKKPSYSKYNLTSKVDKGDVFQETSGGIAELSGHIAIVQGQYYDSTYNVFYIRTIEAGVGGVVYGVLDDERYDWREVKVFSVFSTADAKYGAIDFCIDQLGKDYNWVILNLAGYGYCSTSRNASSWYCSELVWAAYYSQNVNIYGSGIPQNTYYPDDFAKSAKLSSITITAK